MGGGGNKYSIRWGYRIQGKGVHPKGVNFFSFSFSKYAKGGGGIHCKPKGEIVCFTCMKGVQFKSKLVCERTRD